MAAFDKLDKLMQRLGFVKLERYGLLLTPDDRVVAMRPAVLDDGMGSRIVGWRDSDLASVELRPWQLVPTPPQAAAPSRPPLPPRAAMMISPVAQVPFTASPLPPLAMPASPFAPEPTAYAAPPIVRRPRAQTPASLPAMAPEEDWEWTLAAARARAYDAPAPAPAPVAAPVIATPAPIMKSTVIPVPSLTRGAPPPVAYKPTPIVRTPTAVPQQPRRLARGTNPVDRHAAEPDTEQGTSTHTQISAAPAAAMETSTQIQAIAPAGSAAKAIPSIKQRMAGR